MNTKEKIQQVEELITFLEEGKIELDKIYEMFGSYQFKFGDIFYKLFDKYLEEVKNNIGDTEDWLGWYVWENDCGRKDMTVTLNKRTFKVKSVKTLITRVIEVREKQ